MSDYKMKLWLGVGVCTLVGAMDAQGAQDLSSLHQASSPVMLAQVNTGDGGEGGESAMAHVASYGATDYMQGLYQWEGIMRAGRFFYEQGNMKAALAQFQALVRAFDSDLAHHMEELGLEREHVQVEAEQLPQAIEEKESRDEFFHAYGHVLRELDEHALKVGAVLRRDPEFVRSLIGPLLQEVAKAYASKDPVQQASAAGQVLVVRDLVGSTATKMRAIDQKAFGKVRSTLDELVELLQVSGPYQAEASKIYGLAARVEFALSRLHEM